MKAQIGIIIEGQMGLNWESWERVLAMAERVGYQSVFCSDHFVDPEPPDQDSPELWSALLYAAMKTSRIEVGPLVAPVTFRHPTMTVRQAAAVDHLSGGRLVLGLGLRLAETRAQKLRYSLLRCQDPRRTIRRCAGDHPAAAQSSRAGELHRPAHQRRTRGPAPTSATTHSHLSRRQRTQADLTAGGAICR